MFWKNEDKQGYWIIFI